MGIGSSCSCYKGNKGICIWCQGKYCKLCTTDKITHKVHQCKHCKWCGEALDPRDVDHWCKCSNCKAHCLNTTNELILCEQCQQKKAKQ